MLWKKKLTHVKKEALTHVLLCKHTHTHTNSHTLPWRERLGSETAYTRFKRRPGRVYGQAWYNKWRGALALLELQRFIDPRRNPAVSWDVKLLPTPVVWAAFTPNDYTVVLLFDSSWSMGPAHCGYVLHTCAQQLPLQQHRTAMEKL